MTFLTKPLIGGVLLVLFLVTGKPVHAEYLRIELKVYGLDCQVCARGVSKSVGRLDGVESVTVSLKTGILEIVLKRGNTFKMSALRKRIKENGFRSMEAKVTAVGSYDGSSKFHVLGSDETYDIGRPPANATTPVEVTFDVH